MSRAKSRIDHTFIQYGPDGKINSKVQTRSPEETKALQGWMLAMRNRGYIGPFLLEGMLKKIRKEKPWKKQKAVTIV